MMREMRRQDRKLEAEEVKDILKRGEYGVLATVTPDGLPYSIPMSYAYDEEENAIYLHCTVEGGQKIDNISANPHVCFTVVSETEVMAEKFATKYWSANAMGEIITVKDTEEKKKGLFRLIRKYSRGFEEKGLKYIDSAVDKVNVLKLNISSMSGKARKK